mmetsp:Transcript_20319/g.62997  ORF Transcript_20319/g.62997 Transcript_20319/m.62997 type:complete len:228 (-) Transcript_20319:1068-1751(-)
MVWIGPQKGLWVVVWLSLRGTATAQTSHGGSRAPRSFAGVGRREEASAARCSHFGRVQCPGGALGTRQSLPQRPQRCQTLLATTPGRSSGRCRSRGCVSTVAAARLVSVSVKGSRLHMHISYNSSSPRRAARSRPAPRRLLRAPRGRPQPWRQPRPRWWQQRLSPPLRSDHLSPTRRAARAAPTRQHSSLRASAPGGDGSPFLFPSLSASPAAPREVAAARGAAARL